MKIEQFVMAYLVEQDRVRALLPNGFESLRPVLRINTEIRDENIVYVEFNTPVECDQKRGWINIANWSSETDDIVFARDGKEVKIKTPFLDISYTGVGIEGGCPTEKDNDGCFFISGKDITFKYAEVITQNKEFCDGSFSWLFHEGDGNGKSIGETLPAYYEEKRRIYPKASFTAENFASIPCRQVLGAYIVRFER